MDATGYGFPLFFPHCLHSCPVPVPGAVVAPQGLQLLKSTEDSLLVSWEPSSQVDHYLLSYYPLGKERSVKQIQVPKEQHSYEILGLLPGTKYIVTLRNVKKEISSSPQHLLATTGEEAARCPRFPRGGPILSFFLYCPHKYSSAQAIALIWDLKNIAAAVLGWEEKSMFLFYFLCSVMIGSSKPEMQPAGLGLMEGGSSPSLILVRSDCPPPTYKQPQRTPASPGPHSRAWSRSS